MSVEEILAMIVAAEYEAGGIMRDAQNIIAENKTDARNVVTKYDRKVQEKLIASFRQCLPDSHFFCEENGVQDSLNSANVFIIDPIDGTANFVHGFNHSCVSVAYAEYGVVQASAVYNPYADEMFTAIKGNGAFLNGKKIQVSSGSLSGSIACMGTSPYYPELTDRTFKVMRYIYDHSLDIRRSGSAELDLCSVASGRAGLFIELMLSYWDYAAGALIVSEAGGKCCSIPGKPLPSDGSKTTVIAMGSGIDLPEDLFV